MEFIKNHLDGYGISEQTIVYLSNLIMVAFIAVVSILVNFIAKKIVLKTIIKVINNNRYTWKQQPLAYNKILQTAKLRRNI